MIIESMVNQWKYKYITLFIISIVSAIFLAQNQDFHHFLLGLGSIEYFGVLISGFLFVSSFTLASSVVLISILTENIHPLLVAVIGGIGAVLGDFIIFKYFKSHLSDELKELLGKDGRSYVRHLVKSKYLVWMLPVIAMLIIASPLPDELGISLLGLSGISNLKFAFISYFSNVIGILAIASITKVL